MTPEEALLLPHDEIDYASFDEDQLLALATQRDEPFIATNALSELRTCNGAAARAAARRIVATPGADRHLRALAITTLFDDDLSGTVALLIPMVASVDDPKVLDAMVEGVIENRADLQTADGRTLIGLLARQLGVVPTDEFTDHELRSTFLLMQSYAAPSVTS